MRKNRLMMMAGKVLDYMVRNNKDTATLSVPEVLTDKHLEKLNERLHKFNVEANFNQVLDDKKEKIVIDRQTVLFDRYDLEGYDHGN